jgi:cyclophilin family peptidyl-prolyl cis-trans isomerase
MKRYVVAAAIAAGAASLFFAVGRAAAQNAPDQPIVTDTVVLTTTMGDIRIELYGKDAPKTVANFVGLVNKGFYNGIAFHRIVPGFVIQAGDPASRDTNSRSRWGRGGESIYGGEFEDELNPNTPSYRAGYLEGTLAMANRGPNTNTSQFFIMLTDNSKMKHPLPKSYTIFGRVVGGLDIVHRIEAGELVGKQGLPKQPVVIMKATATKGDSKK